MPRSRRPRLGPGRRHRDRGDRACPEEVEDPREIAEVRLHDLRHSFGSSVASQGVALKIIGKALGHRCIGNTKRYALLARTLFRDRSRAIPPTVESGRGAGHADAPAVEAVEIAGKGQVQSNLKGDSHRSHSATAAVSYSWVSDQPVTAAVTKWVESQHARPGEESLRATVEASARLNQSSAMNPLRELRAKTKTGEECRRRLTHSPDRVLYGAGHEGRTRDIYLGKVALYH